ncbi:MAG TPA: endonuclease/exonuclease/phosphatase family protein [Jatrophihabitantaceae bacterium]|nr:endonuclease/exonuclease/phosphatase family protein [Jatrophihabitantaceae bacterium]
MTVLRLLTYNVRSLRDDDAAVARVIRAANPHVACIQEAPRFFRWRSKCAGLARRSGMVLVTGGRDAGANLVLSTLGVDVVSTRDVLLSRNRGYHQRGVAMAVLRLDGVEFAVVGTHLDGASQVHQIGELHRALDTFAPPGRPAIVAGDINASPTMPGWQELAARGSDAFAVAGTGDGFTSNVTALTRRIDGIFPGAGITVLSAQTIDTPDVRIASDHLPVLAELELPG